MPAPRVIRIGTGPVCAHVHENGVVRIEVYPSPVTDDGWQRIGEIVGPLAVRAGHAPTVKAG